MITVNHTERTTEARHSHTWRDKTGAVHAAVDLGATWLAFDDAAQARELATVILAAADAMDALPPEASVPDGGAS